MNTEDANTPATPARLQRCVSHAVAHSSFSMLVFLFAVIALAIQGVMVGTWLVDDAGISMAYARNLARHGQLVSQVGAVPVEGFSNPLWVFLLTCFQNLSSTVVILKSLSMGLLVWASWRLCTAFPSQSPERTIAAVSVPFLVLQPSVVIWGLSGLENPLYLAAGVELMIFMCRAASSQAEKREPLFAGVAAACLALTRPEGLLFSPLYFAAYLYGRTRSMSRRMVILQSFVLPILCLAGYVVFRYLYFGDVLPNTYRAKGGPSVRMILNLLLLDPYALAAKARII